MDAQSLMLDALDEQACGDTFDSQADALAKRLREAAQVLPEVAEAGRAAASASLKSLQQSLQDAVERIAEWVGAERENLNQAFVDMLAKSVGIPIEYADALAIGSVANMANPDPVSKAIVGISLNVASLGIRHYNKYVSDERQEFLSFQNDLLDQQFAVFNEAREVGTVALISEFYSGTDAALDLAFVSGDLSGIAYAATLQAADLERDSLQTADAAAIMCEEFEQSEGLLAVIERTRQIIDALKERLHQTAADLPDDAHRAYKDTLHIFTDWLAKSPDQSSEDRSVYLGGTITWNENDYSAGTLRGELDIAAIGHSNAKAGFTNETGKFALHNLAEMVQRGFIVNFSGELRLERMDAQRRPVRIDRGWVSLEASEKRCEVVGDDAGVVSQVGRCTAEPSGADPRPSTADPAVTGGACAPSVDEPLVLLHEMFMEPSHSILISSR